jgi:hypothetical protein
VYVFRNKRGRKTLGARLIHLYIEKALGFSKLTQKSKAVSKCSWISELRTFFDKSPAATVVPYVSVTGLLYLE